MESKDAWNKIVSNIEKREMDISTFTINKTKPLYFSVRVKGNYIMVNESKEHENSSKINKERKIDFEQFEKVYLKYDDYISKVKGTRQYIRDNCSRNSSYIISLIHFFLY